MSPATRCALLLLVVTGAGAQGPTGLEFSGILGQSQPADEEPLAFIGATGAAVDSSGTLWALAGDELLGFREAAPTWTCVARSKLPEGVTHLAMRWDGAQIYFAAWSGALYRVTPGQETVEAVPGVRLGDDVRSFAVAPVGLTEGYGVGAKVLVLRADVVEGYRADGTATGALVSLSRPANADWWYCAVGIHPANGDLLVGSYWPDSKVCRFSAGGAQVTSDGWPRTGQATSLIGLDSQAWMLENGGVARELPLVEGRQGSSLSFGGSSHMYPSGLARDASGCYWLASSQGLVRLDRRGRPTGLRLGGLSGVRCLSAAGDGTIIAAVEDGQRMVRLLADDDPPAPFACDANEPWRTGNAWTGKACGLAWDSGKFLVLDEVTRCLWHFDPWHTGFKEEPWVRPTEPDALEAPKALAAADCSLFLLDGARVLEGRWPNPGDLHPVELPPALADLSPQRLAACSDDRLLLAAQDRVVAIDRAAGGAWQARWDTGARFGDIASCAADEHHMAVVDRADGAVVLLSAETGESLADVRGPSVPGGMAPTEAALMRDWLFVADAHGHRVLRFRIRGGSPVGR